MTTCDASISVIVAPARSAMKRTVSDPTALSPVGTTAHDGSDFQAGFVVGSPKASSAIGRWVDAMIAFWLGERSAENTSGTFGDDGEFGCRLRPVSGWILKRHQCGEQDTVSRILLDIQQDFAFIRSKSRHIHESHHVLGPGPSVRDDRSTVGMADEEHRTGDLVEIAGDVRGVD